MSAFNGPVVFKPGSGEEPTCFHGIRQAMRVQRECSCKVAERLGLAQDTGDGIVDLHGGECQVHSLDLEIVGRGFNWKFERTYRAASFSPEAQTPTSTGSLVSPSDPKVPLPPSVDCFGSN
jgi:hypothetical protein